MVPDLAARARAPCEATHAPSRAKVNYQRNRGESPTMETTRVRRAILPYSACARATSGPSVGPSFRPGAWTCGSRF